jgi:hypothetical protein
MAARLAEVAVLMLVACALCCAGQEQQKPEAPVADSTAQVKQPAKQKAPTGMLTGTVYCADTNLPARRAQIYLLQYSQTSFSQSGRLPTDLDGRFAMKAVPEGDYYVVAVLPGYMNLLNSLTKSNLDTLTEDERKRLLAEVASATISPDQPADVSVRLERGAEIDGTVMYDDGSPAIGLPVNYKLKAANQENSKGTGDQAAEMIDERGSTPLSPVWTDDRGHFRIMGVPAGEYQVNVTVPTVSAEQAMSNHVVAMLSEAMGGMNVYVGGGLRASKAEIIRVDAGGASRDADIIIQLSKLHTIRGQVLLKSTGQPPPLATVELLYADTKETARTAIAPDGEFEMRWVPEGSFILRAAARQDALPNLDFTDPDVDFGDGEDGLGHAIGVSYAMDVNTGDDSGGADLPLVIVGDMDHVSIAVPNPPAKSQDMQGNESQGSAPVTLDKPQQ